MPRDSDPASALFLALRRGLERAAGITRLSSPSFRRERMAELRERLAGLEDSKDETILKITTVWLRELAEHHAFLGEAAAARELLQRVATIEESTRA